MARTARASPVDAHVDPAMLARARRRTLTTLVPMQGVGTSGFFAGYTAAGVLAADLAPTAGWVGIPLTAAVLGQALGSIPLSRYMARSGRRRGLTGGYLVGAAGAGVALAAVGLGSFWLLTAAMVAFGVSATANNLSRYVPGDVTEPSGRARAMSLVVWGATAGALIGPNLLEPAGRIAESIGLPALTGPYAAAIAVFALAAAVISVRLRPEPLSVARLVAAPQPAPHETLDTGTPVLGDTRVLRRPAVQIALASMLASYLVMVMVMAMTPVHMRAHDHALSAIGIVISGHLVGMFALSPLTGWLSDRLGRLPVLGAGATMLALATGGAGLAASTGLDVLLAPSLFVLGLGWNLGFVGGSALFTDALPLAIRARAQGIADLGAGTSAAVGSLGGGVLFGVGGFTLVTSVALGISVALAATIAVRGRAAALR